MSDTIESLLIDLAPQSGKGSWTPDREQRLRDLAIQGLSTTAICAELGTTKGAITGKCFRLGITLKYKQPASSGEKKPSRRRIRITQSPDIAAMPVHHIDRTEPDELPPSACGLMDLTISRCRWPYIVERAYFYCGEASIDGKPYCGRHCRAAFQQKVRQ